MTETKQEKPEFGLLYHEHVTPAHCSSDEYIANYEKRWKTDARRNIIRLAEELLDGIDSIDEKFFDRACCIRTTNMVFCKDKVKEKLVLFCKIFTPTEILVIGRVDKDEPLFTKKSKVYNKHLELDEVTFDFLADWNADKEVVDLYNWVITALGVVELLNSIGKKGNS